jgi:hypothetical protein
MERFVLATNGLQENLANCKAQENFEVIIAKKMITLDVRQRPTATFRPDRYGSVRYHFATPDLKSRGVRRHRTTRPDIFAPVVADSACKAARRRRHCWT